MELNQSKVYIKVDKNNRILRCEGGYTMENIQNIDEWIFIDEGTGDRYNLCQSHYFDKLYTEDGIPRYKWDGEKAILRSDGEIEEDRENLPKPAPTMEERLAEAEEHLFATDEVAVGLYEQQLEQENINIAQDESLCAIYEMMGV